MLINDTSFSSELQAKIECARNNHHSVRGSLRHTDPVLSYTNYEILHQINPNPVIAGRTIESERDKVGWEMSDLMRLVSGKLMATQIPRPDDVERDFRGRWYEGGDHYLLQEILQSGRVPLAWQETWSPYRPRTLLEAQQTAQKRGYIVPQAFLNDPTHQKVSYSESEALYAAYILVSGNFTSWLREVDRDDAEYWRPEICQLTCQFIIPDPLDASKTPYLADQLWIAASPQDRKVRLLVVEIDGELHLEPAEQERSRRRDAMLLAMGYEVYHIAAWWCRIDPFRAIGRFLEESGLAPELVQKMAGGRLASMDDYICGLCGNPIVRRDSNWLSEIEINESGNQYIAHGECAEYLSEWMEISYHEV